jgi:two-component system, NtrC family, nitrogen regulation response regulator NtrX
MPHILVVDDERAIRNTLTEILTFEQFQVTQAENGEEALKLFGQQNFDAVLCDIKMPKIDGMEFLVQAHEINADVPIIMISGHGNVDLAVEATKKGAYDFIVKPPDLNRLLITIRNALDKNNLVVETKKLKKKVGKQSVLIGEAAAITQMKATIAKVAPTEIKRILVTGPNGAGKEMVAQLLHEQSSRAAMALIEVNCAAIPSELIESELFGHEKGAFTSAIKQRIGKFELANGGTLFLDEVGDMSLDAQAKVLRALETGKITRVGGEKEIAVDVRVVAATNKDLEQAINNGSFREDLYHRLSVIVIKVPSLNDRLSDVPLLVNYFLEKFADEYGQPVKTIKPAALELLKQYNYKGNIRELRNIVERLIILGGQELSVEDVNQYVIIK